MTSPWMNSDEAAEYLRFTGPAAARNFRKYVRLHGIRKFRLGNNRLLFRRADLDAHVDPSTAIPRRRRAVTEEEGSAHVA